MSLGNLKDQGNQGKNTPYQLRSIQILSEILKSLNGSFAPIIATPKLTRDTGPNIILSGTAKSVTIYNSGMADGLVLGSILKSGETVTYSVEYPYILNQIDYDATGTELVIATLSV